MGTIPPHLIYMLHFHWWILPFMEILSIHGIRIVHEWNATYLTSEMLAEERRAGRRLDKLFLVCVVPDRSTSFQPTGAGRREWGSLLTAHIAERRKEDENKSLLQYLMMGKERRVHLVSPMLDQNRPFICLITTMRHENPKTKIACSRWVVRRQNQKQRKRVG